MATKNSINNVSNPLATTSVTIDPGASGDSYVQLALSTTDKFRIGVDNTDDSFRMSVGSALGTSDAFVMSADGELNLPTQCAFSAYKSSTASNVTGDNTQYQIPFDTEVFDIGSNYNNTTGVFTAPITGKYMITASIAWNINPASGGTLSDFYLITSNRNYINCEWPTERTCAGFYGPNTYLSGSTCIAVDMDASDTAHIVFYSFYGSKVDEVIGGARITIFTGYLIG